MTDISVAIADDHQLVRAGFASLLDAEPGINVLVQASGGEELLEKLVTTFGLDEYIVRAVRAGASGFLLKDTEPVDLIRAVRVVAEGEALLSPEVTKYLLSRMSLGLRAEPTKNLDVLTDREREVLALVGQGLSNDEIAARLVLSPLTAKTHVSRIMSKVAARDRVHLVVLAYESGLVSPGWLQRQ